MAYIEFAWIVVLSFCFLDNSSAVHTGCTQKEFLCRNLRFEDGYKYVYDYPETGELEVHDHESTIAHSDKDHSFKLSKVVKYMDNSSFITETCMNVTVKCFEDNKKEECTHYLVREEEEQIEAEEEEEEKQQPHEMGEEKKTALIITLIIGVLAVLAAGVGVYICFKYKDSIRRWCNRKDESHSVFGGNAINPENVAVPANSPTAPRTEAETGSETPRGVPLLRLDGVTDDRLSNGEAPLPNGVTPQYMAAGPEVYVDIPDDMQASNGHAVSRASREDDPGGATAERESDPLLNPTTNSPLEKETRAPKRAERSPPSRRVKETTDRAIPKPYANGAPVQSSVGAPSGVQTPGVQTPGDQSLEEHPNGEVTLALVIGQAHDPDPATESCSEQDKNTSGVESTGNKK